MARNKTVPVVFHEKATKQRKSQNGDIIISERDLTVEQKKAYVDLAYKIFHLDSEDENIFCSKECFCDYVQLEETDPLDSE